MQDDTFRTIEIAAAVIRRSDEVLLVRQQGSDHPVPTWALPGGVVERGELALEALAREVREETGLSVDHPGRLAYVSQLLDTGSCATAFVFEVAAWSGEIRVADPDGFVSEARFVPLDEALPLLERVPWRVMREPLIAWLRGDVASPAVWGYRASADGDHELHAYLSAPG